MSNTAYIKDQFAQLPAAGHPTLAAKREEAFEAFNRLGIPAVRNEEWKYTRISSLFNTAFQLAAPATGVTADDLKAVELPEHDNANSLVFVNGVFNQALSAIRSEELTVLPLEAAAGNDTYKAVIDQHFNHSSEYLKDGINALNTAFVHGGLFIHVPARKVVSHPVYIYNITDARVAAVLAQPRSLVHVCERAEIQIAETYITLGSSESLTNQIMEMVVETDANVDYYKIQNDASHTSQVSTTHIRQVGKSVVNSVTLTLNGAIVRNNLHNVMEAEYTEANMYGLYFVQGTTLVDNHTIVDNAAPHCLSNELYKGIMDGQSTGVFNGKIFVRKDAQKINAFQSNKNVLLSDAASVNTKPQLEIFADDVKCSHGCTVGSLDTEALFYLQARGIPRQEALALLLQGFAMDVLDKIKIDSIRSYVRELIAQRLTLQSDDSSK